MPSQIHCHVSVACLRFILYCLLRVSPNGATEKQLHAEQRASSTSSHTHPEDQRHSGAPDGAAGERTKEFAGSGLAPGAGERAQRTARV
eukprot:5963613-Pleurochrysis_carterae.AAC.1